jgi:23S rRNA (cytidine2498-2'-O)-methyltransferase
MTLHRYIDKNTTLTAYLAFRGFEAQLKGDLNNIVADFGRLIVAEGKAQKTYWAQNIWYDTKVIQIESIGKAAKYLKDIQRNWFPYSISSHRRQELITEKLPKVRKKRLKYLADLPKGDLGSFSLLDNSTLLYAAKCSESFPDGEAEFEEDKSNPPSRAYLKLWETFTRTEYMPKEGDHCLELGASPGGWSWVISELGANLVAVDRSPLDPKLMKHPLVTFESGDAFKFLPEKFEKLDWIFSDLICYPDKLYEFVNIWLNEAPDTNFVCTIKFQGSEHYAWVEKFEEIKGSKIIHLYHNKHEFTWINFAKDRT